VNHENNLTDTEEEKLAELFSDLGLQSEFNSMNITQFWVKAKLEHPILHEKAMKMLSFAATHLHETTFLVMTIIKSKQMHRLVSGPALSLSVTSLTPTIEKLKSEKEQQSH
jgi:hypothetical protein